MQSPKVIKKSLGSFFSCPKRNPDHKHSPFRKAHTKHMSFTLFFRNDVIKHNFQREFSFFL